MLRDKSNQKGFLEILFIMLISVQATAVQDNKVGCHQCTVPGTCTLTSEGVISSTDDCYAKCEQRADCLGIQYDNGTRECNIFFPSVTGNCNGIVYNAGDVYVYRKSYRTDCSMLSLSHFWGIYTTMRVHRINPSTEESCLEECFERDGCFDLTFVQMSGDCFIYDDCTGCSEMSVPGFDSYRYLCIEGSFTSTSAVTASSTIAITITPESLPITSSGKGTSLAPTTTAGRLITTAAATGITSTATVTPGLLTSTASGTGTPAAPTATLGLRTSTAPVTGTSPAPTATLGLLTSTAPVTGTPPSPTSTFSTIITSGTGITLAPTTTAGPLITTVPGTTTSSAMTTTPGLLTSIAPGTVMTTAPTANPGLLTSTAPGTGMTPASPSTPGLLTSTAPGTGMTPASTATPGLLTSGAPGTRTQLAPTATPRLLTSTATGIGMTPAPTATPRLLTSTAAGTGMIPTPTATPGLITSTAPGTGMTPAPSATPELLTSSAHVTGITLTPTATPGLLTCTATTTRTLTPAPTAIVGPQTSKAYGTGTSVSTSAISGPLTTMKSVSMLSSTSRKIAAVSKSQVLGNNSATSTSKPIYVWPCLCSSNSFSGLSQDRIIEQLVNDVKIDTSQTLLSLSKKRCMDDFRMSAKSIGIIAAAMMATCGGVFILLDILGWISGHLCH